MKTQAEEKEEQRKHEQALATIKARNEGFLKSPFWFTVWDISTTILNITFWIVFWFLIVSCTCNGCILK